MPAPVYKAMVAGIESQIQELQEQIHEYEQLQNASNIRMNSIEDLPHLLIKARVAKGYSQKDLADKVGLKPQQLQRYEATDFQSASLKRILEIMKVLEIEITTDVPLKKAQ